MDYDGVSESEVIRPILNEIGCDKRHDMGSLGNHISCSCKSHTHLDRLLLIEVANNVHPRYLARLLF